MLANLRGKDRGLEIDEERAWRAGVLMISSSLPDSGYQSDVSSENAGLRVFDMALAESDPMAVFD